MANKDKKQKETKKKGKTLMQKRVEKAAKRKEKGG